MAIAATIARYVAKLMRPRLAGLGLGMIPSVSSPAFCMCGTLGEFANPGLLLSRCRDSPVIRPLFVLADHKPHACRLARGQLDRCTLAGEGFIALRVRRLRVEERRHVRLVDAGETEAVATTRLGDHDGP